MDTKRCEVCGKEFEKPKVYSQRRWKTRRYCSQQCFGTAYSEKYRKPRGIKSCQVCDKEFQRALGEPMDRWAERKYCSTACAYKDRKGSKHPNWKGGGRYRHEGGYWLRIIHPDHRFYEMASGSGNGKRVMEHRLVMAEHLDRPLRSIETVHHKNGKRDDNRIENLELRVGRHGKGAALCCGDCGSRNIVAA